MYGSRRGPTSVRIEYSDVVDGTNSVCQSVPPQVRLPTFSGTSTVPRCSPPAEITQTPPGPVTQTFPCSSHFIPSGMPSSITPEPTPSKNTRPFESEPSLSTSQTLMCARGVSLMYSTDSSGEKQRPFGMSNSSSATTSSSSSWPPPGGIRKTPCQPSSRSRLIPN